MLIFIRYIRIVINKIFGVLSTSNYMVNSERQLITNKNAYSLEINKEKNRVYFCIRGHWDKTTDLNTFLSDWKETISHLQPNFTIISDVRTRLPHALSVEKLHEQAQKYLMKNGLLKVAEVVAVDDIANLQSCRISERSNFPIHNFHSFEEAENYLDDLIKEIE